MTEKEYYECPVCSYNYNKIDLFETKKELSEHLNEAHERSELTKWIIGDIIRYEPSPEELEKRKIVKNNSSSLLPPPPPERPHGKNISPSPLLKLSKEDPISVEDIRRIVRHEMNQFLARRI